MSMTEHRLLFSLLALLVLSLPLKGQNQGLVLNGHSMVYHEAEKLTYIFGGATDSKVLNDLWAFRDTSISSVEQSNRPEPRTFAGMVYRQADSSVLLFGGSAVLFGDGPDHEDLKNDTWLYQSGRWTRLNPTKSPKPRAHAAITYDKLRERVVLFGGYEIAAGKYLPLGDTWEFHHDNWHLVSETGPSPRIGSSMVFDTTSQRVILFGGSTHDRQYGDGTGETWAWDGKAWIKLSMGQPANHFDSNMVFDQKNERIVRFGGWTGKARTNETWVLTNKEWQQKALALVPPARNHSQMVYDVARERIVLFGGHNGSEVYGDVWVFADNHWLEVIATTPRKRIRNLH